ncbi:mCG144904, partial [Mus musculus]
GCSLSWWLELEAAGHCICSQEEERRFGDTLLSFVCSCGRHHMGPHYLKVTTATLSSLVQRLWHVEMTAFCGPLAHSLALTVSGPPFCYVPRALRWSMSISRM